MNYNKNCITNFIATDKNWFDGNAISELLHVSTLNGMQVAAAMPDMHSGKYAPNGAAFLNNTYIYPHLVGNDIGCGYGFWQTDFKVKKFKIDRIVQKLVGIDRPYGSGTAQWVETHALSPTNHDQSIGTIGGGNHFAELQQVESIIDSEIFQKSGLCSNTLYLLVHSGSRGLGESILRNHIDTHKANGLTAESLEASNYLAKHDHALKWATASRALIAKRFTEQINTDSKRILDLTHNYIETIEYDNSPHWLHRKGASPSNKDLVMIPGSRGTLSYLVRPISNSINHAWSLSHGAGRRWDRTSTEKRLRERFRKEALLRTPLGGRVICEDKSLLFQEAPEAYKNIDKIIQHLEAAKLIQIVAKFRPLITYKKRSSQ